MTKTYNETPLLVIRAESGTGKTTLLTKIIPILKSAGFKMGCIKHTHHQLTLDTPGKDSYILKDAGIDQMLLGDSENWALFGSNQGLGNNLKNLLEHFNHETLDLILIEGFAEESIPNIVIQRSPFNTKHSMELNDNTIAIAGNRPQGNTTCLPYLNLDKPVEIATFIINYVLEC